MISAASPANIGLVKSEPISCEEAWRRILARAKPLEVRQVPLREACGLTLAKAVRAPMDVPPFDNSAMDGFAVRITDITVASADMPRELKIVKSLAAGEFWSGPLRWTPISSSSARTGGRGSIGSRWDRSPRKSCEKRSARS